MQSSVSQSPGPSRASTYLTHLQNDLLPALHGLRSSIAKLEWDISEYQDVVDRLISLAKTKGEPIEVMTELGAGIWVDAQIPDTSTITLDLGLNVHVEMPIMEAVQYAEKRVGVLQKRRDRLRDKERNLVWQVEQFQGAMSSTTVR